MNEEIEYLYITKDGGVKRFPSEMAFCAAWRKAKELHGEGGELFRKVPAEPNPTVQEK